MTATDRMRSIDRAEFEHDPDLLTDVLRAYRPGARYLREMTHRVAGETIGGTAELAIAEPCYIDDTGHLNAVDALIGYNQMTYLTIATVIRHSLHPAFGEWSMADFRRRHLPDIVIADTRFSFTAPIDSRRFRAELSVDTIESYRVGGRQRIALTTSVRYGNDTLDACRGEVRVVIVDGAQ